METSNNGVTASVPDGFRLVEIASPNVISPSLSGQRGVGESASKPQSGADANVGTRRNSEDGLPGFAPPATSTGAPPSLPEVGFDADAILQEALGDQALTLARTIEIAPAPSTPTPQPGSPPIRRTLPGDDASDNVAPPIADFHVDVNDNEAAALLIVQNGVYQWALPETEAPLVPAAPNNAPIARRGQAEVPPATRRVTFRLPLSAQPVPTPPDGTGDNGFGVRRAFLPDAILNPIRVYVFKFVARLAIGAVIQHFERRANSAFVRITQPDPAQWQTVADPHAIPLPAGRSAKILLLIHGTFSSTVGGYGALGATTWGQAFLQSAWTRYDAVLGYDHPTLSVDPSVNAAALLRDLKILFPFGSPPPQIDVIAHSRGGLVFRSLAELLLPGESWKAQWGRAILVAVVNEGTLLGAPENWKALLDTYTNLAVQGCNILALFPQATATATILKELIADLGAFLKALSNQAVDDSVAPGLAAMRPDGAFLKALNVASMIETTIPNVHYYAVTSEFDMNAPNETSMPITPSERILGTVASQFLNRLMGESNDLVVNTPSMAALALLPSDAPVPFLTDVFPFGRTRRVYHTTYFTRPETTQALANWLGFTGQAAPPDAFRTAFAATAFILPSFEDLAASERVNALPPHVQEDTSIFQSIDIPHPIRRALEPDAEGLESFTQPLKIIRRNVDDLNAPPIIAPTGNGQDIIAATAASASAVACHLLAEMPDVVLLHMPTTLLVSLSRDEVAALLGTHTLAEADLNVAPDAPLVFQAVPIANMGLIGTGQQTVALPAPGDKLQLAFLVQGTAPGAGEVRVLVMQNQTPLATLKLTPQVIDPAQPAPSVPAAPPATVTDGKPITPTRALAKPLFQMFVFERRNGSDISFQYLIQSPALNIVKLYASDSIGDDRDAYVNAIYKQIEDKWNWSKAGNQSFRTELQAIGAGLFRKLFPVELQSFLCDNRQALSDIMVVSYEPFIPWEIVHLREPTKPGSAPKPLDPNATAFLGDMGLVRWLDGSWPPDTLRIRPDKAFTLIPNYAGQLGLQGAAAEKQIIETFFPHAQEVLPDPNAVQTLLANPGAFDLLHYAGHGIADSGSIEQAGLALSVTTSATGTAQWTLLKAETVEGGALWAADGGRAIVFLNACQVGREGYALGHLGGFAQSFLESGAGAFVGPLWSVVDSTALAFVTAFYQSLHDGATLAEATRQARQAANDAERNRSNEQYASGTHLAYAVYGHPQATINRA